LALVYEYAPHLVGEEDGSPHGLHLMFECTIVQGIPSLPEHPDVNQTNVRWVDIEKLDEIILYPNIKSHIKEYVKERSIHSIGSACSNQSPVRIELIEEHKLEKQSRI
ncbi:MAG: hydrolase, partial [Paenibacillus sp.]|nr:hydrolase [Paenibacillus sp.]